MHTTTSIEIGRPAAEVFDYLADMSNNPEWQKGQVRCTWTSAPPIAVGSTYDQEARFMGRTIRSSFEVTEFEPGHRIRIRTTGKGMPIDVTRTVEPLGQDRCRAGAEVRGTPPLMLRLLAPLTSRMMRKSIQGDYERLRSRLES